MDNHIDSQFSIGQDEIEYMSRIKVNYDSLSASEKRIANYVLANKEEMLNISIHTLSKKIGVSSPTITRFCQNLGFKGFNEFKYYVEKELLSPDGEIEPFDMNDSLKIMKQKLFKFNKEVIDDTLLTLNDDELEKAIQALSSAKKIDLYGEGGSGATAMATYNLFLQIGLPCNIFNDSMLQVMSASQLKEGDVAIGITHSGSIINTVQALKLAKEQGATTICITGRVNSPVTEAADIVLYASSKQKPFISDLPAARISELCVVGMLQVGILMKNYDKLASNMKKAKKAMNLKRSDKKGGIIT